MTAIGYYKVGKSYYKVDRSVITNWGYHYNKLGRVLQREVFSLMGGSGIANWSNYYKVGQHACYQHLP